MGKNQDPDQGLKFFDKDQDPGSGIFLTLDLRSWMEKFVSGINITVPQHSKKQ
jgi:hypothetical protein